MRLSTLLDGHFKLEDSVCIRDCSGRAEATWTVERTGRVSQRVARDLSCACPFSPLPVAHSFVGDHLAGASHCAAASLSHPVLRPSLCFWPPSNISPPILRLECAVRILYENVGHGEIGNRKFWGWDVVTGAHKALHFHEILTYEYFS